MANAVYPRAKQGFLAKELDMDSDAIKLWLIDSADYTYSSSHTAATDVAAGAKEEVVTLAGMTLTNGTFDSNDATFTAAAGDPCEALICWNDTPTTPVADPLIFFMDTSITGMPVTLNGGDVNVAVNASGWFAL